MSEVDACFKLVLSHLYLPGKPLYGYIYKQSNTFSYLRI